MEIKEKIKEGKYKAKIWFDDHQTDIMYGCYMAACIAGVISPIIKKRRKHNDRVNRNYIYDPSMHCYWETKKPLTNNQMLMFEQRRRRGEPCGHILKDLGVLKR